MNSGTLPGVPNSKSILGSLAPFLRRKLRAQFAALGSLSEHTTKSARSIRRGLLRTGGGPTRCRFLGEPATGWLR